MHLSKSKYVAGLSCLRYLWVLFNDSGSLPELSLADMHVIEQGNLVGEFAKKLFPEGVGLSEDFEQNLEETKDLLKQRKTLFEAGILHDNLYARADILIPVKGGKWDVVEVKASTKVKDEHLQDVSFQKYVYESAGLNINKCFLLHINKEFVKRDSVNPEEFFIKEDITEEVDEATVGIKDRIKKMLEVINKPTPPDTRLGAGCNNKLDCPCEDCWSFLPENNVFELYYGGKKSLSLLAEGVELIKDIPKDFKLSEKQEIQKESVLRKKPCVNKEGIKKFLDKLQQPLYYFDFETFQTAIPIYDGTKPYQQIPFQFSLHIDNGEEVKHYEYLHDSKTDPRKQILEEMKKVLGTQGSIIVFNQSFEKRILKELGEAFPEYKEWTEKTIKRLKDLIKPFRNFDYYNPKQKGKVSIKKVLPAITGKSYKELNIDNGGLASVTYFENTFQDKGNKEEIRKNLIEYCGLDTEGMVWIVEELEKLI